MRPCFRIYADSRDITAAVQDRFQELKITDEAGIKSDKLSLTLDDRRTASGAVAQLPRIGTRLAVAVGYRESSLTDMGSYLVDEIEISHPPATLRVGAKAADMAGPFRSPHIKLYFSSYGQHATKREDGYAPRCGFMVLPRVKNYEILQSVNVLGNEKLKAGRVHDENGCNTRQPFGPGEPSEISRPMRKR